jgi:hypothetical protein
MNKKITCYTEDDSAAPRLHYILDLLSNLLACSYEVRLLSQYKESQPNTYAFAYLNLKSYESRKKIANLDFIPAANLLYSDKIEAISPKIATWQGLKIGFSQPHQYEGLAFDLLSWSFYLVSRYEEYLDSPKDAHNRFPSSQSLAAKEGFLRLPLVNLLAKAWEAYISQKIPTWQPQNLEKLFQFQPSYDIDYMFAFKNKGVFRQFLAVAKNILSLDFQELSYKISVWRGKKNDPFDTFDYIEQLHKTHHLQTQPFFFFLIADWGKFDKNISYTNPKYKEVVAKISNQNQITQNNIGLHPSYASNDAPATAALTTEKKRLADLTNLPITKSRQHFLRLNLPQTYQRLLEIDINADFSMGYADALGFRASIATPFYWFDLQNNKATNLIIYPFAIMDVTMKDYLKLSPADAKAEIDFFIAQYKTVGGLCIPVWHNSSLGDYGGWGQAWREVYEHFFVVSHA